MLVTKSPNLPLSEPASSAGRDGAVGAAVSIVICKEDEAALVLPAASVALAVRLCAPAFRFWVDVMLQTPFASAAAVPRSIVPPVS